MSNPIVSTGRGGQGNIGRDETKYVDAGIVREGVVGESTDGDYSSGRGGAGNIVDSPRLGPDGRRLSHDKIPDTSLTGAPKHQDNYHVGRGGDGNAVHAGHKEHLHEHKDRKHSLLDKAKHLFHGDKKEEDKEAAK
jgi:hypothetical protein